MKIKFKHIMLVLALSVAGCAAYFSVWGLSQLFAGASTSVIIMASTLEISKIVTTKALNTYWYKLSGSLKIYLSISVVVLMLITSAGIYGFLSNAYQQTANKLEIHEGAVGVLDSKRIIFEKNVADNKKIIEVKTKRIDQLSNIRGNQETRLDGSKTNRDKSGVRSDISNANTEIQKLSADIDVLNTKNTTLTDSIGKYSVKALELKSGSAVAAEVGPLKYIAELTGIPMASVVNYLILLIIFVFDPLSIALVLATNKIFELQGEELPFEPKKEKQDDFNMKIVDPQPLPATPVVMFKEEHAPDWVDNTHEEPVVEEPVVEQPNKVQLEDIKEIKQSRGFSVDIPNPKKSGSNTIERIGSNKIYKNGENNKLFFKRD